MSVRGAGFPATLRGCVRLATSRGRGTGLSQAYVAPPEAPSHTRNVRVLLLRITRALDAIQGGEAARACEDLDKDGLNYQLAVCVLLNSAADALKRARDLVETTTPPKEARPPAPVCGKWGCNQPSVKETQGSLRYNSCERHRAEIEELVDGE